MRGWVAAMHTDVVGERMGDAKHRQRPPIGPLAVAIPERAVSGRWKSSKARGSVAFGRVEAGVAVQTLAIRDRNAGNRAASAARQPVPARPRRTVVHAPVGRSALDARIGGSA